jgi:hypothetical protein
MTRLIALIALAGGFTAVARSLAAGFPFDRDALIEQNRTAVALGGVRSLFFLAAAAGVLWLAMLGRIPARVVGWSLAAIVAIDLWSVERHYWIFSPPASVIYGSDPAIEFVQKAEPGRVVAAQQRRGVEPHPREPEASHDAGGARRQALVGAAAQHEPIDGVVLGAQHEVFLDAGAPVDVQLLVQVIADGTRSDLDQQFGRAVDVVVLVDARTDTRPIDAQH